jgi:hypothetical protein
MHICIILYSDELVLKFKFSNCQLRCITSKQTCQEISFNSPRCHSSFIFIQFQISIVKGMGGIKTLMPTRTSLRPQNLVVLNFVREQKNQIQNQLSI